MGLKIVATENLMEQAAASFGGVPKSGAHVCGRMESSSIEIRSRSSNLHQATMGAAFSIQWKLVEIFYSAAITMISHRNAGIEPSVSGDI